MAIIYRDNGIYKLRTFDRQIEIDEAVEIDENDTNLTEKLKLDKFFIKPSRY